MRQPRHPHIGLRQQVGDVMRGGLAIDGGIQRQNDLGHLRRVGARHQLVDGEILRADAVDASAIWDDVARRRGG